MNNLRKVSLLGEDFDDIDVDAGNLDNKYTSKVSVPQYLPKNVKPNIRSLCNDDKYRELVNEIYESDVTDEEKEFLIKAATRHIVFQYHLIADYYAHASKRMQELMEKSALVIIDIDDAIANGYVKLSKTISDIMLATGSQTAPRGGKSE